MSRGRITQIVNNANFGEINNLLSQGRDMEYIARHYNMDLSLFASAPLNLFFPENAGQTYSRNCWKNPVNRKKIVRWGKGETE